LESVNAWPVLLQLLILTRTWGISTERCLRLLTHVPDFGGTTADGARHGRRPHEPEGSPLS
jgi:hypothetical protein